MTLQNGYKKIYEHAANGERTIYATASDVCDPAVDTKLGSFVDAEFAGRFLYEHNGKIYAAVENIPAYDKNGVPTDDCILDLSGVAKMANESDAQVPAAVAELEPVGPAAADPEDEPETTEDPEEVTED